jgi:hypothetical protein
LKSFSEEASIASNLICETLWGSALGVPRHVVINLLSTKRLKASLC